MLTHGNFLAADSSHFVVNFATLQLKFWHFEHRKKYSNLSISALDCITVNFGRKSSSFYSMQDFQTLYFVAILIYRY